MCGAEPFRPDDTPNPSGPYARTKLEAEERLREICADRMELVILRPPVVYGPSASGFLGTLVGRLKRGAVLPLGTLHNNRRQMIGVDNFADAIAAACLAEKAPGGALLPADVQAVSIATLIEKLAVAYQVQPKLLPIPEAAFRIATHVPVIGPAMRRALGNVLIEDTRVKADLDWTPPLTLDEGLDRMAKGESA